MNVETLLQQGNDAFEREQYKDAITNYSKALISDLDNHEAFYKYGLALLKEANYAEAIPNFDKVIDLKPDYHRAWRNRGCALALLGDYQKAIFDFNQATTLKPDDDTAWFNYGLTLDKLDRHEEAISCYDKALQIEPSNHETWHNKGIALSHLDCFEKAIISYDKALKFKPDYNEVWLSRGLTLHKLGHYEEAIISYDEALKLKADFPEALGSRGNVLADLGRHEEAIISYDNALKLNPNLHDLWNGRGVILCDHLRQYKEAMVSFDEALRLTQDQNFIAWNNRGITILHSQGYRAALNNWDSGIKALLITNPGYQFGCGQLYYRKGNTQYTEGCKKVNPLPYWRDAKDSYLNALNFLSVDDYPVEYLNTLQELHTIYTHLFSPQKSLALLQQASDVLERVLQNSVITAGKKISLKRKFPGFNQLQVKILAQEQPIQALEHAEAHKNLCLGHLRNGWNCQSSGPSYTHIQNLLSPRTAVIYWHLSPAALTTFIIRYGQSPEVFRPKPAPSEPNVPRSQSYPPAAYQLHILENWIQEWKQNYRSYRDLDPKAEDLKAASWRKLMDGDEPFTQLPAILEINRLCEEYLDGIDQLILIPHRDLHLLPLHAFFPERFTISYLPSAQMGLELHHRDSLVGDRILCIEDPTVTLSSAENKKNLAPLTFAKREVEAILHFYKATNNSLISGKLATKSSIAESLNAIHDCLHFTGHGFHNIEEPLQSALLLANDDRLTLKDIFQLNLQDCSLVCLAACETGITSTQNIIDEYIGLVSGFLAAGAAHVISTLWIVEDESSSLLMAQFHNYLRQSLSPAQALGEAQKWLRTLTYQKLSEWYQTLADELDTIDPGCTQAEKFGTLAREAYKKIEPEIIQPPYAHPYYWAGFIITGKVPGGEPC
jgi:CHAT domain-containing protein/Flp pilus assembly protein TadD